METAHDILDASQLLSFAGDFDQQVSEIMCRVRLTRAEVENLQCLIDDLQNALCYTWPACQVYPFGSIVTGLGIKTSDIDCFIQIPPECIRNKSEPVNRARNVLRHSPAIFAKLMSIPSAKIPILKFIHQPTGFNCDINFSSLSGVRNSKLIAFLLNLDPRALPLAIIIKYWSKVYNLTGTNLMPNYALTMMVIFFLQVKSILPSVAELQRNRNPYFVENWNTAFNDNIVHVSNNGESLYELLGGFFNYYKSYDYVQYVISPFLGCSIKKLLFTNPNTVPGQFSLYKEYVSTKTCNAIRLDSNICIQDPFEHSRNCSVAVFGRLFGKILTHFELAAKTFNEKPRKEFLRELLTMDVQVESQVEAGTKTKFKNKIKKKELKQAKANARHFYKQYYNFAGWQKDNMKKKVQLNNQKT